MRVGTLSRDLVSVCNLNKSFWQRLTVVMFRLLTVWNWVVWWAEDKQSRAIPKGKICYVIGSTHAWEMHANCKLVAKWEYMRQLGLIWTRTTDIGFFFLLIFSKHKKVFFLLKGRKLRVRKSFSVDIRVFVNFVPYTRSIRGL